jgi:hypothetical protein
VKEREKEKRKWEDISFLSLLEINTREKKDIEKEIAEKERKKESRGKVILSFNRGQRKQKSKFAH